MTSLKNNNHNITNIYINNRKNDDNRQMNRGFF